MKGAESDSTAATFSIFPPQIFLPSCLPFASDSIGGSVICENLRNRHGYSAVAISKTSVVFRRLRISLPFLALDFTVFTTIIPPAAMNARTR